MPENQQLEGGAYEVIRARLEKASTDLSSRLSRLNESRQEVFGSVETALVSTERVSTEHNCVPRDIIAVGHGQFLFGYNIQFGLKATTAPEDVFAGYHYDAESHTFTPMPLTEIISDSAFQEDFAYLYKYYKTTVFLKFMVIGPHLYMGMQVGKTISDLKAFKWLMKGDGTLEYLGNRFDHEYKFPPQQEFEWKRAHRDMQRSGEHPHISIEDRVFVETVGGDLTVKIEDNTSSGAGIYAEPVTEADQSLDDAEMKRRKRFIVSTPSATLASSCRMSRVSFSRMAISFSQARPRSSRPTSPICASSAVSRVPMEKILYSFSIIVPRVTTSS